MSIPEDRQAEIGEYARSYTTHYGFEAVMVAARRRLLRELLSARRPDVVVEVGCGNELLCESAFDAAPSIRQWVIVEPSAEFAQGARGARVDGIRVDVLESFVEDAVEDVLRLAVGPPGLVICSSVLHEVQDPLALLAAARALAQSPVGIVHVNVPNALSLHRRLAHAMGLIQDVRDMSARNCLLGQHRVFDTESLHTILNQAGLRITDCGGYMLKPFTHDQMAAIPDLSGGLVDGLWAMGRDLPDLAAEIYANAEVAK